MLTPPRAPQPYELRVAVNLLPSISRLCKYLLAETMLVGISFANCRLLPVHFEIALESRSFMIA